MPWHTSTRFEILQFALLAVVQLWLVVRGALSMGDAWQWEKMLRCFYRIVDGELTLGPLLKRVGVTLNISWIAMILTVAIGLPAVSLIR